MFALGVDTFFLIFLSGGFVLLFGLWFYYDRRDKYLFEEQRSQVVFHCIKCGHIYAASHGQEMCACPKCAFANNRLQF